MNHFIVGILIFILAYVAIISEKLNRTIVAILGAALMIIFHILDQADAVSSIDFNTIGLLIGMMITVSIMKQTGLFQYLALKMAKIAKGNPIKILIYFSIITAVASGLLDNVTTILLIVPVTLVIVETLEIKPTPFIIAEIMSANIGGAATLIGDPPNIMIGSATGYTFLDFIVNLGPIILIIFIFTISSIVLLFKKQLKVDEKNLKKVEQFDENKAIKDKPLLIKSLTVLGIVITGFVLAEFIGLESATIALFGAGLLLLLSKLDPEDVFNEVEWPTIFFFLGLFILVGSLESIGVISILASKMLEITGGSVQTTTVFVLWMSAVLSAFLDNIPYVATMIPLVQELAADASGNFEPVWWALSIGACLGGNGTIIGASANVVARGITEKNGYEISFLSYMKIAFVLMILSIALAMIYLLLVF